MKGHLQAKLGFEAPQWVAIFDLSGGALTRTPMAVQNFAATPRASSGECAVLVGATSRIEVGVESGAGRGKHGRSQCLK